LFLTALFHRRELELELQHKNNHHVGITRFDK